MCGGPEPKWERYPNMLCVVCQRLARDEQGRRMRFSNETLLGTGFIAEVDVNGTWRRIPGATDEASCWINGRRCLAREHRFGGIVVQLVDE